VSSSFCILSFLVIAISIDQTFYSATHYLAAVWLDSRHDLNTFQVSMISNKESFTYRISFNLNKIKIYVTYFQFSFQCFDIHFKYIIINVILEMLFWKSVTTTSYYCIVQKFIKSIFEMKSYFLEMFSDSDFQHIEIEFNEIEVQKVWW